jgi:hypothetical protein
MWPIVKLSCIEFFVLFCDDGDHFVGVEQRLIRRRVCVKRVSSPSIRQNCLGRVSPSILVVRD